MFKITKTFKHNVYRQPDGALLGTYDCEVTAARARETSGHFEVNIKDLDEYSEGGLWFEHLPNGQLSLVDFDGVHCLSEGVIEILREQDVYVDEDFR